MKNLKNILLPAVTFSESIYTESSWIAETVHLYNYILNNSWEPSDPPRVVHDPLGTMTYS